MGQLVSISGVFVTLNMKCQKNLLLELARKVVLTPSIDYQIQGMSNEGSYSARCAVVIRNQVNTGATGGHSMNPVDT